MAKRMKKKFCPKCGDPVQTGALFCPKCGKKISSRRVPVKKSRNPLWLAGSAAAIAAILITVVVFGMDSYKQRAVNRAHNASQIASIIGAFNCSCGQCDKTLRACDCPTAIETQSYISKLVKGENFSRKEIIERVNERYGHLRSRG